MKLIEPTDVCEYRTIDSLDIGSAEIGTSGITILPEIAGYSKKLTLKSSTGDFVKWLSSEKPDLAVKYNKAPKLALHSDHILLPLVLLASDVSIHFYLQLVYDYLCEKAKNLIKGEEVRVRLKVVAKDDKSGKHNELEFEGNQESLSKLLENWDLDRFTND